VRFLFLFAAALSASVLFTQGVLAEANRPKPTVVLVHGAFADASSWDGVIKRLQRDGYPVLAPANPLRGVSSDAAYISSFLDTVGGPVVLVGHSYGGAVITNAGVNHPNVKALVYVAAFIPDVGQKLAELTPLPGSLLVPPGVPGHPATLILRPCPPSSCGAGFDAYIDPAVFHKIFAADLDAEKTAIMAVTQRPASLVTLGEPTAAAAWKTIPAWALIATRDNAIGTANVRAMARHAGAQTVEVQASHSVMLSEPDAVVRLIRTAARATD
jgi:pimeloyl-ACP methyl ester carboxylesterase